MPTPSRGKRVARRPGSRSPKVALVVRPIVRPAKVKSKSSPIKAKQALTRKKTHPRLKKSKLVKPKKIVVAKSNFPQQLLSKITLVTQRPVFWLGLSLIGINLTVAGGLYFLYQRTILSFKVTPTIVAQANLRGPQPTDIEIKSANINLPIIPVQIREGIWEIPTEAAGHLYTSARPAEGGNIVIYAHNKKSLFGPLANVKVGDTIGLITDKNTRYDYQVTDRMVVDANQIEAVAPSDHEILTVYTCTGWMDSKRLVVKALPMKVSSL